MRIVLGVDGFKGGWVAVVLHDGAFVEAASVRFVAELAARFTDAAMIAVDIPIGLSPIGSRPADLAAKAFVGPLSSSVFLCPARAAFDELTFDGALAKARSIHASGFSIQTWALKERIVEVERDAARDPRIVEVHPEVSFAAMNGRPLRARKKTWNGQLQRRHLLEAHGISLPNHLAGVGDEVPVDDLLDAAAAAWSADRLALGMGQSLPATAADAGAGGRIWY